MPFKDPEKRKQYQQEYRNLNREEIRQREKARRQTDEGKEKTKQYRLLNKEKNAEEIIHNLNVNVVAATQKKINQHTKEAKRIYTGQKQVLK